MPKRHGSAKKRDNLTIELSMQDKLELFDLIQDYLADGKSSD